MTPPMSDNWHQTNQVVMAVQTAEIKQSNLTAPPALHLSCNLVNIARGHCNVIVTADAGADSGTARQHPLGAAQADRGSCCAARAHCELGSYDI